MHFLIGYNIPLNALSYLQKINNMKNLPEKIYLQIGEEADIDDDIDFNELVGVSWCSDKIEESDIEFVRSDITEQMAKEYALSVLKSISDRFCGAYCEYHGDILDEEIAELEDFINSRKAQTAEE